MTSCNRRRINSEELLAFVSSISGEISRFQMAYFRTRRNTPEIVYLLDQGPLKPFLQLEVRGEQHLPSLAHQFPMLSWYEREIMDTSEIEFTNHPESYPLMLLEGMRPLKPYKETPDNQHLDTPILQNHLPQIDETQVQDLFWGPIRGDIQESVELHFAYVGEEIVHFQPKLFYKHRGIERRFEGLSPLEGVYLSERISGVGSITHSLAYCQAIEDALSIDVPERAKKLRIVIAELERIYNTFHFFSLLAKTTTLKVGEAFGAILEEEAKQINAMFCHNRFGRNTLCIGGLRNDLNPSVIASKLSELESRSEDYLSTLFDTQSFLDRLLDTGILEKEAAFDFGATGPAANASGLARDLRVQHPYSLYDALDLEIPLRDRGDALARAHIRRETLTTSFSLVNQSVHSLEPGPVRCHNIALDSKYHEGLGWSEGPRGACIYAVQLTNGKLSRVKIKSPSFSSWKAFPLSVHKTNLMDYAINEASFGLSVAGVDR